VTNRYNRVSVYFSHLTGSIPGQTG